MVKAAFERKKVAGTVGAKCIYHSIKEVDEQFGRKMGMGIGR